MKNCPRCAKPNPEDVIFCGRCGLNFSEYVGSNATDTASEKFCYRHPRVATELSCGRCEKPLCTRCVILGPAGPRCKECAKHNVAFRPGVVVHSAKSSARSIARLGPYGIYLLVIIGVTLFGFIQSCARDREIRKELSEKYGNELQLDASDK